MNPIAYIFIGTTILSILMNAYQAVKLSFVTGERDGLKMSIEEPMTGYIARLTTAQNNTVVCINGLNVQNTEIAKQGTQLKGIMDKLESNRQEAARGQVRLQSSIATVQSIMPQMGGDACLNTVQAVLNVLAPSKGGR